MAAVKQDGYALVRLGRAEGRREIVMTVKQDSARKYASAELKGDREM